MLVGTNARIGGSSEDPLGSDLPQGSRECPGRAACCDPCRCIAHRHSLHAAP